MKKYMMATLLCAAVLCFGCGNSNSTVKSMDTVTTGNSDSSGSQPVQTSPGAANGGNATDTIGRGNEPAPRTDSVIKH